MDIGAMTESSKASPQARGSPTSRTKTRRADDKSDVKGGKKVTQRDGRCLVCGGPHRAWECPQRSNTLGQKSSGKESASNSSVVAAVLSDLSLQAVCDVNPDEEG